MSDKFAMHAHFPLDHVFLQKAIDRGQHAKLAETNFVNWRKFWMGTGQQRTLKGWLKCWDNDCRKRAQWAAGAAQQRAEPEKRAPVEKHRVTVGGRIFSMAEIIALRRKQSLRQPLEREEQLALEKANG